MQKTLIDCKKISLAFSVPNALVDSYINSLTELHLKVILYLLRHNNEEIPLNNISEDLNTSILKIKEALIFLRNKGIIKDNLVKSTPKIKKMDNKNSIYESVYKYQKPDSSFVVSRINSSDEIAFLMKEAQNILGRPISNLDSATLIMIHDTDGLPINVILMLMEYCTSIGKSNMRYIEKVAVAWGNEGIDTIEKAEKKIKKIQKENIAWNSVRNVLGLEKRSPTSKESELCNKWIHDLNLPLDLIKKAFDKCVNVKGKYIASYIDAILKDWINKKINDVNSLNDYNKKIYHKNKNGISSYDIEDYLSTMDVFA